MGLSSSAQRGAHPAKRTVHGERKTGAVLQFDEVPSAILQFEVPGVPRESKHGKTLKYLLHIGRLYWLPVHPRSG